MNAADARLRNGSQVLRPDAIASLKAHAMRAYPEECVGYIDRAGNYNELVNEAEDPRRGARVSFYLLTQLLISGNLRAYCHSHPDGPDAPSETDMRSQLELAVPFIIVSTNGQACAEPFAWGDELLDERDLIGRPFRHGVDDCYALMRACYLREQGVFLPEVPRSWEWWQEDTPGEKDLYGRYFREAGFYPIRAMDVRPGDGWLAAVRSKVPNHAGYILPDGLTLHHPSSGLSYDPARLSKRDPVARWQPYVVHWLRRE